MIAKVCTCMRVVHIFHSVAATNLTTAVWQFERFTNKKQSFYEEESILFGLVEKQPLFSQHLIEKEKS